MTAPLDISGKRYGRLIALQRVVEPSQRTKWLFVCDCGEVTKKRLNEVLSGDTRSCGCLHRDIRPFIRRTHGRALKGQLSPEYVAWQSMKNRCGNPKFIGYRYYGGRGISVCPEWRDSFESFLAHVGERPSPAHSIDRLDTDGDYAPGNVRWATASEQSKNRRAFRRKKL